MVEGTLNFLQALKLEVDNVLTPSDLKELLGRDLSSGDVFRELSRYAIARCLEGRVGSRLGELTYSEVHAEALKCWVEELSSIMELTSPDDVYRKFVATYVSRHEVRELINVLKQLKVGSKLGGLELIGSEVLGRLEGVATVPQVVSVLRELRTDASKLVADALLEQVEAGVKDVNLEALESRVREAFWRRLDGLASSILSKNKLSKCLRVLRTLDSIEQRVRAAFLEEGEVVAAAGKAEPLILDALDKATDVGDVDAIIQAVRLKACFDELKYSPLSADIMMPYLVGREFEVNVISFVIHAASLGLWRLAAEGLKQLVVAYEEVTGE